MENAIEIENENYIENYMKIENENDLLGLKGKCY